MTAWEDILAKLITEPITKIIEKPGQGGINTLEQELAEKAALINLQKTWLRKGANMDFY